MRREELPVRPHVPASACAALGALASSAVLLQDAWSSYGATGCAMPGMFPLAACAAVPLGCGALAFLLRCRAGRGSCATGGTAVLAACLLWLGAGVMASTASSCLWVEAWGARCEAVEQAQLGSCRFVLKGDPSVNAYGASMMAEVRDRRGTALGRVRLTADRPYDAGAELDAVVRLEPLDESDWARGRFMKGEVGSARVVHVGSVRSGVDLGPIGRLRAVALDAIQPARDDARALIAGIVCGRTTELNQLAVNDDFSTAGLTHLVAVSGSHLAFIAALLQGVLRRVRVAPAARSALLVTVMAAYVAFTGCAASAVRSVVMVGCGMLANLGRRRAHPLSGLSLTATVLVVADPGVTFDLGFQLSAASVLFILVFGRYLTHLAARLGAPPAVAEGLSLTLAAQWATVPLTLPVFGVLSLIAPLANLVAGPVMSALLVTGLVVVPARMLLPGLEALMACPEGLARASLFLARLFAGLPHASLAVSCTALQLMPCYLAAVAVYLLWADWKRWQLVVALLAAAGAAGGYMMRWSVFAPAALTVLDVGQADAILLRDGSSSLLVDAGVDDAVVDALARNHVYRLDAVAVTHWDRDHWGGLPDLLALIDVDRIYVAEGAARQMPDEVRAAFGGEVIELREGDALRVGGFICSMVWPHVPVTGEENADSLCLDVSYRNGGRSLDALLTGDAERDELSAVAEQVGDIDLLKVGHHGSKASVDAASLDVLEPELAVASAGARNSYGHPSGECIEAVTAAGALFLCTVDAGDVDVRPGEAGVRVQTTGPHVRMPG